MPFQTAHALIRSFNFVHPNHHPASLSVTSSQSESLRPDNEHHPTVNMLVSMKDAAHLHTRLNSACLTAKVEGNIILMTQKGMPALAARL
jgi:hypothetical protein